MTSKADGLSNDEVHVCLEKRLRREGRDDLADVLESCRVPFELKCLCCANMLVVNTGCKKRWCPVCAMKVVAKRYKRTGPTASRMQWPLSVMFSMKNPLEIKGCVAKLQQAFKSFRRTKFWTATVKGGYVGFEITYNNTTPHVHLHALVDCEWLAVSTPKPSRSHTKKEKERLCQLAQLELSAVWAGYLGQPSAYVWPRRADKRALAETLKYPIKPRDLLDLKCKAGDIIDEIDRGRMVAAFGNCSRNSKVWLGTAEPEPVEKLCRTCKVDRSIFPKTAVQRWERGISAPPKRAEEVMDLVFIPGIGVKRIDNTYIDKDGQRRHDETGDAIPW